ncbi:unnamed protein product, partial [Iphiclides podalirius]
MKFTTNFGSGTKKSSDFPKAVEAFDAIEPSSFDTSKQSQAEHTTMFNNSSCFSKSKKHSSRSSFCPQTSGDVSAKTSTKGGLKQMTDAELKETPRVKVTKISGLFKKAKAKVCVQAEVHSTSGTQNHGSPKAGDHAPTFAPRETKTLQTKPDDTVAQTTATSGSTGVWAWSCQIFQAKKIQKDEGNKTTKTDAKTSDSKMADLGAEGKSNLSGGIIESEDFPSTPSLYKNGKTKNKKGKKVKSTASESQTIRETPPSGSQNWVQKMCGFAPKSGPETMTKKDKKPEEPLPKVSETSKFPDEKKGSGFFGSLFLSPVFGRDVAGPPKSKPGIVSFFNKKKAVEEDSWVMSSDQLKWAEVYPKSGKGKKGPGGLNHTAKDYGSPKVTPNSESKKPRRQLVQAKATRVLKSSPTAKPKMVGSNLNVEQAKAHGFIKLPSKVKKSSRKSKKNSKRLFLVLRVFRNCRRVFSQRMTERV